MKSGRPLWKGTIGFGLVSIPVSLHSVQKTENLRFHFLHKTDLKPIHFARVEQNSNRAIPWDEIVRGYEYKKGKYVILDDKDFKRADLELTKSVSILEFVDRSEVDPLLFDKPYALAPDTGGKRAYSLLAKALHDSDKLGIAKVVIRNKQHLAAITERKGALMLELMHFAQTLRPVEEIVSIPKQEFSKKEIQMAHSLISQMTDKFDATKYTDTYKKRLLALIEKKRHGKLKVPKETKSVKKVEVGDLMSILQESLKVAK